MLFKTPNIVIETLNARFWHSPANLKQLLKNQIEFPIIIPIKAPSAKIALDNLQAFAEHVSAWRALAQAYAPQNTQNIPSSAVKATGIEIYFESKNYRAIGEQSIPRKLVIAHFSALIEFMGRGEDVQILQAQFQQWKDLFHPKTDKIKAFFDLMVDNLDEVQKANMITINLLAKLIPQLKKNMGQGQYLRALPLKEVDTKFVEMHSSLIEQLATVLVDDNIAEVGLFTWLDVRLKPKHWLLVIPLCDKAKHHFGDLPLLRLPSDYLQREKLPVDNLIIVENEQSALCLPHLENTVAIAGAGKNITWLDAPFFQEQNIGYWGDIDSEGLTILSEARKRQPHITSIMMDEKTVNIFQDRMVQEPLSIFKEPSQLTQEELELFRLLRSEKYELKRLEQERMSNDYVKENVELWLNKLVSRHFK